jgi:hypothetical protein
LFQTNYKSCRGKGWFKPHTFKKLKLNKYKLWFPKFVPNKAGWDNKLVNNGNEIISRNINNKKGKAPLKQENITFGYDGNEYSFTGVFRLVKIDSNGTEHWRKRMKIRLKFLTAK